MQPNILYIQGITEIGGAERDLLSLLKRMDYRKWRPIVACPGKGPLIAELKSLEVPVYPMEFPAWRKLSQVPLRIPVLLKLNRLVRSRQIALIHVNDLWWAPLGCIVAKWRRIPSVISIRQNLEPRRIHQYHLKWANRVITVSRRAHSLLIADGMSAERVHTVYSGIDTDYFSPTLKGLDVRSRFGIPPDAPVIGCVANLNEIKGHDILIRAFSQVVKKIPRAQCILVGRNDSPYGKKMHSLVEDLGLEKRVFFAGFQTDVRPYISAMDLVVQASRSEALGIALLEAMSMGKPVVSGDVGGIAEVIKDGVTGLLVPHIDHTSLSSVIISLLADPARCRFMGQEGRSYISANFNIEQTVRAIENIYENLLTSSGSERISKCDQ